MSDTIGPVEFDRDTGYFFQAARIGKLVYRHCLACNRGIHMPSQSCKHCGSVDTEWRESAGKGTLFSWTTVTHQVHPAYKVPYTIMVVALDDAPDVRLIGSTPGNPALTPGQKLTVTFPPSTNGTILPQWKLVDTKIS